MIPRRRKSWGTQVGKMDGDAAAGAMGPARATEASAPGRLSAPLPVNN